MDATPKERHPIFGGAQDVKLVQSKGQWGSQQNEEPAPKKETNSLFGSMKVNDGGKKRLDDDSDNDDYPVKQTKKEEKEINLLDFGNDS